MNFGMRGLVFCICRMTTILYRVLQTIMILYTGSRLDRNVTRAVVVTFPHRERENLNLKAVDTVSDCLCHSHLPQPDALSLHNFAVEDQASEC